MKNKIGIVMHKYHKCRAILGLQPPQALIDGFVNAEWHQEDQQLSPLDVIFDNPSAQIRNRMRLNRWM